MKDCAICHAPPHRMNLGAPVGRHVVCGRCLKDVNDLAEAIALNNRVTWDEARERVVAAIVENLGGES